MAVSRAIRVHPRGDLRNGTPDPHRADPGPRRGAPDPVHPGGDDRPSPPTAGRRDQRRRHGRHVPRVRAGLQPSVRAGPDLRHDPDHGLRESLPGGIPVRDRGLRNEAPSGRHAAVPPRPVPSGAADGHPPHPDAPCADHGRPNRPRTGRRHPADGVGDDPGVRRVPGEDRSVPRDHDLPGPHDGPVPEVLRPRARNRVPRRGRCRHDPGGVPGEGPRVPPRRSGPGGIRDGLPGFPTRLRHVEGRDVHEPRPVDRGHAVHVRAGPDRRRHESGHRRRSDPIERGPRSRTG